ncbi:DUF3263 domain-containing protein [Micromonospora coxensis]|uniref:DUF3263 domain-containing protein n=1 Tax=Micromonospora coxensis TaxID=356852 RepID=A0A1C5IHD1_9ACTN|nr:DUF3263 domain-containing protein [Micromonospora coxensis]SCG57674.1 Protein of unknown function [Micromonospora coxensis]
MPPADAAPAAADRSEPSPGRAAAEVAGRTVPPPRSVPPVETTGAAPEVAGSTPDDSAPPPPVEAVATGAESDGDGPAADALTEREQRILAFERQWWRHAGAKEQAIRDTFGLSATRYYQLLNALLDRPAALAAEPVLVGRLRRLRSSRARNRRR